MNHPRCPACGRPMVNVIFTCSSCWWLIPPKDRQALRAMHLKKQPTASKLEKIVKTLIEKRKLIPMPEILEPVTEAKPEQKPPAPYLKIGVMLAIPMRHFRGVESLHPNLKMLLNRLTELSADEFCPYEFQVAFMEGGLVRARNMITAEFMEQNKKNQMLRFLITLDDDMDVNPDASEILKLLSHRRPLVGALYTTRDPERPHWVATFMHEVELQKNGLLQVIECGTGMKCHHIKVYTELARILPNIHYTDRDSGDRLVGFYQHAVLITDLRPDGDLLPEDYYFDHLCRMSKIGIFVDTTVKVKHRGADGTLYPKGDWPAIPGITEVES